MKFNFKFLLGALLLVLILSACTKEESQGVQEITLTRFFGDAGDVGADISAATGEAGIIQAIINAFDEQNPNLKVNTFTVGWGEYYDQLKASFAQKNPPNIFVLHAGRKLEFTEVGALADLTPDLARVGIDSNDFSDRVKDLVSIDGKIYGVPMDVHGFLWHVNVDLFKQAGLVDAEGNPIRPTSIDELLEQAAQFKKATGKSYMAGDFSQDITGVSFVLSLIWQQGADIFDGDKATMNTPESKKALEFIKEVFDNGYADPTLNYSDSQKAFLDGDVGVLLNGTWVVNFYDTQVADPEVPLSNYKVYTMPTLFSQGATFGNSHMWAIPSTLKSDKQAYENALQLLAWIYKHNYDWSRTGHITVSKKVLAGDEYKQLPHRTDYKSTLDIIKGIPASSKSGAIQDAIQREFFAVWLTGKDVDTALADLDSELNSILSK